MTTKLPAVANAWARTLRLRLSAGQRHDAPQALPLLEGMVPADLVADRGYDSDLLVAALAVRGTCAVIPQPQTPDSAYLRCSPLRPAPPCGTAVQPPQAVSPGGHTLR